ncbi:UDP-3-O-(3-hydroxymyristoyl)glucosamine N-acyltransferase [Actomonas aquatica]|uniref:UDP-3-O-acylglucosamine N-acyltransferase n=1 Tax=Actomonas aquatica TaxID=2866162 RepID=A0ABZ1C837_9BACT|nr:UDP-3-O-(3-hydroxymyristoyl)glucosamine N-acyltransferase [Opitutus sp. WL0086]WRQ87631.1 UDP-3-O-(3-hydroxymyristoyl)glucosamine N-acyltransferase [Opitutus sp. WL0086]
MKHSFDLAQLEEIVSPEQVRGSTTRTIHGIAALKEAEAGDLSFLGNAKYKVDVPATQASLVLLPLDYEGEPGDDQCFFLVKNPSVALATICSRIEQRLWPTPHAGIHASAVVSKDAEVHDSATVGPLCVIEAGAKIGPGTHLQAHVFVGRGAKIGADCWLSPSSQVTSSCILGDRVRLHGGVIVGSDGFGYELVEGRHAKVPQVGSVEVGDDVEIGANSTIDRARFSRTVIGRGTKIDNLVQIGHNVVVGQHCILCAQVGISGSTTLEDYVVLGGQVGVGGHITLAKGTQAGGQTGITANTEPGVTLNGTPAMPFHLERRLVVLNRKLPDLFKRVGQLETLIEAIKKTSA